MNSRAGTLIPEIQGTFHIHGIRRALIDEIVKDGILQYFYIIGERQTMQNFPAIYLPGSYDKVFIFHSADAGI